MNNLIFKLIEECVYSSFYCYKKIDNKQTSSEIQMQMNLLKVVSNRISSQNL